MFFYPSTLSLDKPFKYLFSVFLRTCSFFFEEELLNFSLAPKLWKICPLSTFLKVCKCSKIRIFLQLRSTREFFYINLANKSSFRYPLDLLCSTCRCIVLPRCVMNSSSFSWNDATDSSARAKKWWQIIELASSAKKNKCGFPIFNVSIQNLTSKSRDYLKKIWLNKLNHIQSYFNDMDKAKSLSKMFLVQQTSLLSWTSTRDFFNSICTVSQYFLLKNLTFENVSKSKLLLPLLNNTPRHDFFSCMHPELISVFFFHRSKLQRQVNT